MAVIIYNRYGPEGKKKYEEELKKREESSEDDRLWRKEQCDKICSLIPAAFFVVFICYGIPLVWLTVCSFWKYVVVGDTKMSYYTEYFNTYTFERINLFYQGTWQWIERLLGRLVT